MKDFLRPTLVAALLFTAVAFGTPGPARAELRVVDGNLWAASSVAEKRAYLIGVANVVAVNRVVQAKLDKPDQPTTNDRIDAALDVGTIDSAIKQIDGWYAANPSRKDVPVLGVVWMAMVKAH
jgi:hypothetical protein